MPGYVAAAIAVVAAGVSAYGEVSSSEAASDASKYNAAVARNNSIIASNNATQAAASGEAQAEQASFANRAKIGGIKAQEASSGIDVNSGSALDVQSSAQQLGELNTLTVRSNAAKVAYGYETQNMNYVAQAQLDQQAATNDITAGDISAGGTILGGLSNGTLMAYQTANGGGK